MILYQYNKDYIKTDDNRFVLGALCVSYVSPITAQREEINATTIDGSFWEGMKPKYKREPK